MQSPNFRTWWCFCFFLFFIFFSSYVLKDEDEDSSRRLDQGTADSGLFLVSNSSRWSRFGIQCISGSKIHVQCGYKYCIANANTLNKNLIPMLFSLRNSRHEWNGLYLVQQIRYNAFFLNGTTSTLLKSSTNLNKFQN